MPVPCWLGRQAYVNQGIDNSKLRADAEVDGCCTSSIRRSTANRQQRPVPSTQEQVPSCLTALSNSHQRRIAKPSSKMYPSDTLSAWIKSNGGHVHPKLDLCAELPNGDRGVVAREVIAAGEQLALIPVEATIHVPSSQEAEELGAGKLPVAAQHLLASAKPPSPFISTVLMLMAEFAKGDSSKWLAYIKSLPPSCDCLLSWNAEDKALLKGTSIEDITEGSATETAFKSQVQPQVEAAADLWPAPYNTVQEFCRVAGLVQSRAFHIVEENWVTGTKKDGAELYLIPGIDMINHAANPDMRNSTLLKFNSEMKVEVDGQEVTFRGFFTMKAEKDLQPGDQVLHTYGDLGDAQLLQTYGFIDDGRPVVAEKGKTGKDAKSGKKRKGEGKQQEKEDEGGFKNPHNMVLIPLSVMMSCSKTVLKEALGAKEKDIRSLETDKLSFLQEAGLLQASAQQDTQFVVTASQPLPDEILTVMQVLLMLKDEFDQLVREYRSEPAAAEAEDNNKPSKEGESSKASEDAAGQKAVCGVSSHLTQGPGNQAGSSSTPAEGSKPAKAPLLLGEELLGEDLEFAELVSLTLIQVVDECMKRYPSSIKQDTKLLSQLQQQQQQGTSQQQSRSDSKEPSTKKRKTGSGSKSKSTTDTASEQLTPQQLQRQILAVKVRLTEMELLQDVKRASVMLVFRLQAAADQKEAGEGEDDEDEYELMMEEGEDSDSDEDAERLKGEGALLYSDDSDKVGYSGIDYDDGIGEAHDRGKAH